MAASKPPRRRAVTRRATWNCFGSLGWEHSLLPSLPAVKAGLRGALGLACGGAMPSGGGVIGKAAATLSWQFAPGWQAGLETGWLAGIHGQPRAQTLQAWIAMELDRPQRSPPAAPEAQIDRNEWVATVRHLQRVDRKDGSRGSIDTLGGSFNHALGGPVYLSLQAHSAFAGGAGAYSIGLVGAGLASASGTWRVGAEALLGAPAAVAWQHAAVRSPGAGLGWHANRQGQPVAARRGRAGRVAGRPAQPVDRAVVEPGLRPRRPLSATSDRRPDAPACPVAMTTCAG